MFVWLMVSMPTDLLNVLCRYLLLLELLIDEDKGE